MLSSKWKNRLLRRAEREGVLLFQMDYSILTALIARALD